ncbi:MAG: XdhC/CoxI family protein [Candidatus Kapaibacterium sp.]
MHELLNIERYVRQILESGHTGAIATLVRVHGSSYRRPGARMVLVSDGTWHGAISGGCLEGDVLLRAQEIMNGTTPRVVRYDTTNDENNVFGVGLGCNGIIDILIEPFHVAHNTCVKTLHALIHPDSTTAHAIVFESTNLAVPVGTHWVLAEIGTDESLMPKDIVRDMREQCRLEQSVNTVYSSELGTVSVFIEIVQPQTQLVLFGAGYDTKPVVDFARTLGWHVTVTDKSPIKANQHSFPNAHAVVCAHPQQVLTHIQCTERTVCILMSHNFMYDTDILEQLVTTSVKYIGILGPRKRWEKMQIELEQRNVIIPEETLNAIYSPVGLDLAAETPEEIALSMIAEIQHVLHGGSTQPLRIKPGTIHERTTKEI